MTRIGLLSDTHRFFDKELIRVFAECDEIWHAGDVGSVETYQQLINLKKPVKGVFGNIDGKEIRHFFSEILIWNVEKMKILMTHIGGSPGKYPARIKNILLEAKPDIFICGHSHILKVIYDKQFNLLHINPGACGREGFHKVRTIIRFSIDGDKVKDMEVVELGTGRHDVTQ